MAWGWVIINPTGEKLVGNGTKAPDPSNTNNVGEFWALGFGIKAILEAIGTSDPTAEIIIRGDSQIVIYTLIKQWECRAEHLIPLRDRCRDLLLASKFKWIAEWVRREFNTLADEQSRLAYFNADGGTA